jgi:phage-related baseplate assembly protein
MNLSVLALFVAQTADSILSLGLSVALSLGLPVTSWRTGDPTRSLYKYLAVKLASIDGIVAELAKSAFLSTATGAWLKILALEVYGVTAQDATFATGTLVLVNNGGGYYPRDPGDLAFKSSITGKTYHSTTGGILNSGPGTTLTLDFIADDAGSDYTLAPDELDTLVTTLLGVAIQSSTQAIGLDDQDDDSIRAQCRDSLGALSPNGPADAYRYVARNSALTGVTTITRALVVPNAGANTVTVYVAGAGGAVTGGEVSAVQTALDKWATPLTVTATAVSASGVTFNMTMTVAYSGGLSDADLTLAIREQLIAELGATDIGGVQLTAGGIGVPVSAMIAAVFKAAPEISAVTITSPGGDTALLANQVPVLGTTAVTVV